MEDTTTVADSAPTAEAATVASDGLAATQDGVTHGDATTDTTPTTDDTAATPETADADPDDDEDDSPPPENQTEEEKSKAQRRRERRQAREQERIQQAVAAEIAQREQRQQQEATTRAQQKATEDAARARQEKLAAFLGTPDAPEKPGTLAALRSEIDDLNRQIRSEMVNPAGADLDALAAQVSEKESSLTRLTENNRMAAEIENLVWSTFETDFVSATAFPELADPATKNRYLRAEGGVRGALGVFRDAIIAAKDAEKASELAALTTKHQSQVKALEADRAAWRARAGGAEVADTAPGGAPISAGGLALTPERYAAMSYEDRQKLRSTPEGRRQIDDMTRARIGAA